MHSFSSKFICLFVLFCFNCVWYVCVQVCVMYICLCGFHACGVVRIHVCVFVVDAEENHKGHSSSVSTQILSILFCCCCCYFRHCFSLSWILLSWLGWLASEPQRFASLCLSALGLQACTTICNLV